MANEILNPQFDGGLTSWSFYSDNPNNTCKIENGQAVIRIGKGTGSNVQLYQYGLRIEAGKKYRLSFKAKTEGLPRAINVVVHEHASPYTPLGLDMLVTIGPSITASQFEFVGVGTTTNARLRFAFAGGTQPSDVLHVDDVVLEEAVVVTPPVDPPPVDPPPVDPPVPTDYEKGYATGYAAGLGVGSHSDTSGIVNMLVAIAGVWVPSSSDVAP